MKDPALRGQAERRGADGPITALVAFTLLLAAFGQAQELRPPNYPLPVRASHLKADLETGAVFVMDRRDEVWRLHSANQQEPINLGQLARLSGGGPPVGTEHQEVQNPQLIDAQAISRSFSPLRIEGAPWLVAVGSRPASASQVWQTTIALGAVGDVRTGDSFRGASRRSRLGRLVDVAFDSERSRLLLSDPQRQGIYEMQVTVEGLGDLVLAFSGRLLREVGSLTALGDKAYVTEQKRKAILEIDLGSGEVSKLAEDLPSVDYLAVSPLGRRLVVGGSPSRQGLRQLDLESGDLVKLITSERKLGQIVGLAIDARDHLWIAGQNGAAVFEFGPGLAPSLEREWRWRRRLGQ